VSKVDVLVIMPHPDDAEFTCAGTIARWVEEGKSVAYVLLTNGDKGTSDRTLSAAQLSVIRQKEQLAAADVLGVKEVVFLGYPDQGLEDCADLRKDIVCQIRSFCPSIVVTLDPYRRYLWHRDHRIAGQVVADAVFPYSRDHLAYPDLLDKGLQPHSVKELFFATSEQANHLVDISSTFDKKMKALGCHKSQIENRIDELRVSLEQRARETAHGCSFSLAEAFHLVDIEMMGPYRKKGS